MGVNMELFPHVGWANAVPDAETIVALDINGTTVTFVGSGYHDKVHETGLFLSIMSI